jgi:hypothetical protein
METSVMDKECVLTNLVNVFPLSLDLIAVEHNLLMLQLEHQHHQLMPQLIFLVLTEVLSVMEEDNVLMGNVFAMRQESHQLATFQHHHPQLVLTKSNQEKVLTVNNVSLIQKLLVYCVFIVHL